MIRSFILSILAGFAFAAAHAAVDVNKATQAELEGVKGLGPSTSTRILDERKQGSFKDWPDLITRVKGVGTGNAARFSAGGLTVGNTSYAANAGASQKAAPAAPLKAAAPAAAKAVAQPEAKK
jgi:competence protein ComEA